MSKINIDIEIELPKSSQRILDFIKNNFNGNVRQFCLAMGLSNTAKINRLFSLDKRTNKYPIPSLEIISLISKTFDVSADWLINGNENNNIDRLVDIDRLNCDDANLIKALKDSKEQLEFSMKKYDMLLKRVFGYANKNIIAQNIKK